MPFKVRRVYCVARNYADQRLEMAGNSRDLPFFFQKPHDAIFQCNLLAYPINTAQLGYEAELVAIMEDSNSVFGYALGMDLTKRDVQSEAKKLGKPWESSKSFDRSALIGPIVPAGSVSRLSDCIIELSLNGEVRQSAKIDRMIWSVPELVEQLKKQDFGVQQGDVLFTGTPAGVGLLSVGDECVVSLRRDGADVVSPLSFTVVQQSRM